MPQRVQLLKGVVVVNVKPFNAIELLGELWLSQDRELCGDAGMQAHRHADLCRREL